MKLVRRRNSTAVRGVLVALVAVCVGCVFGPSTVLAGTLDQQQLNDEGGDTYVDSEQSLSETFTAGVTGQLDRVDLDLRVLNAPTLPMTVEIRNVTADLPGSTVLASQDVGPSGIIGGFEFIPIVFAAPASVASGTQYAIVAYSATVSPVDYSWARSFGKLYPGGSAFYVETSPPSTVWLEGPTFDYAFKTYVAPPPSNVAPPQAPAKKKKCKKKKHRRSAESAKKKKCKKKKKRH